MITGIAGQDGSYLAEMLIEEGVQVHGTVLGDVARARPNLSGVAGRITLHDTPLCDPLKVAELLERVQPSEIFNLAAPSSVYASWDDPSAAVGYFADSTVGLLEGVRKTTPEARFFQASSSEIFRGSGVAPQSELTIAAPRSPYGAGKLLAHNLVDIFRRQYGLHASCGILYNHESPRRGPEFVTQRIVRGAVDIKLGEASELRLGNTGAQRDWGYAVDYVRAMRLMLEQEEPGDYVIATGTLHTVAQLAKAVFAQLGLDADEFVIVDPALFRTEDDAVLVGDASMARDRLGWEPKTSFESWLGEMVDAELARRRGAV